MTSVCFVHYMLSLCTVLGFWLEKNQDFFYNFVQLNSIPLRCQRKQIQTSFLSS